ncbi:DUF3618 domain-containing protein [Methylobacterium sp. CM6247]
MSKSFDELEHDVEASRGRLDGTLAELHSRLNPSNLAEELTGTRDPVGATALEAGRLSDKVRANPLPMLLISAGFAFLAFATMRQAAERRRLRLLSEEEAPKPPLDAALPGNHPYRLEEKLGEALEETFPGSDPVSVRITK